MQSPGKIGRLPRPVQKELNRRLLRGDSSTPILEWLNPLPEVQAIMQAEFGGAPINKQNLCDWRATGLIKWTTRREVLTEILEFDGDAAELDTATQGCLAERLATNLAGRYARLLHHWDGEVTDEFTKKARGLRSLAQDVSHLRRWDHSAARVRLEQTRVEASQEPDNEALFMKFEEWALNIGVQEYLTAYYESERDRERARRKLLHLPPLPEDAAVPKSPAPGARLSQPQHAASPTASDNQSSSARQSAPLTSFPMHGGADREEAAHIKNKRSISPTSTAGASSIQNPSQTPDPRSQTQPSASSTPSPEANSTPKPLETLTNSSSIPPISVNPCQPPVPGARLSRPWHSAAPTALDDQPSSDRQSDPLASISVNGGAGRGEEAFIKNVTSPSQTHAACAPEPGPVPTVPESPVKSPLPPACKAACDLGPCGYCRKCCLTPAEIDNWPRLPLENRGQILCTIWERRSRGN